MPKKRFSAEQIVTLFRQIEVLMAQPYGNAYGYDMGTSTLTKRSVIEFK
jgi:hypothetical protein